MPRSAGPPKPPPHRLKRALAVVRFKWSSFGVCELNDRGKARPFDTQQ
jgi:hypothetical protein